MSQYSEAFDSKVLADVDRNASIARKSLIKAWTPANKQQLDMWENIGSCIRALKYKLKELENDSQHLGD